MTKKIRFPKTRPEQNLGFLFWQTTNLWQRAMTQALSELDLTHVQFVLLAGVGWLDQEEPMITQVKLSNHAKTDIMMTSKVVRTLEEKGFITRSPHAYDPRAKSLKITNQGVEILEKALIIVGQVNKAFFKDLSPEEHNQFIHDLRKLLAYEDD